MQHNLAPIFCFSPSVVPRLRPEKNLLDLFFPVEYLGDGQRGLDGPKSIPRFSWYISTYDVGGLALPMEREGEAAGGRAAAHFVGCCVRCVL